jgi:glyoxylase-like metal-dependent hydrolase (beta-lactamase superfamily II)
MSPAYSFTNRYHYNHSIDETKGLSQVLHYAILEGASKKICQPEVILEILPNILLIPNVIANSYLLIDADGLTLIDAGLPGSHRKVLRFLSSLGFAPKDLKRILITHADYDHVGGLAALKNASCATIFASRFEAQAMAEGHASRPVKPRRKIIKLIYNLMASLFKPAPVKADGFLAEGQILPVLGGLQVVETPGHTPGHVSFFLPSAGVLFCGDSIVSEKNGLRGSGGANTWDQEKADGSVRKQATLGVRMLCSGHGPVVLNAVGKIPPV